MTSTSRQFQTATDGGSSSSLSLFLAASASFAAASEAFEASVDFAPSAAGAAGFAGSPILSCHLRSEEHTSELQSRFDLVCRLLLEKKNHKILKVLMELLNCFIA